MIQYSFYFGTSVIPRVEDGSLFHYTLFDNFMKIINSKEYRI